jgi:hypothetical protein|tara:strand:- start:2813 stop:3073 length:261 start_codon:yes stop_codon:yes gene_type:complete
MTDKEYKKLYDRIKRDLYDEFINPQSATYGLDIIDENIYEGIESPKYDIKTEIKNLKLILQEYLDKEEYEKAALTNQRINELIKKL